MRKRDIITAATTTTRRDFLSFQQKITSSPSSRMSDNNNHRQTKEMLQAIATTSTILLASFWNSQPSGATTTRNFKSRNDDYRVQKSDAEWKAELSDMQYFVLRQGGTENPNFSILESEYRPGIFSCAGCGTDLFDSRAKFRSGTGWPSFARGINGRIEVIDENVVTATFGGIELRCKTCGGHLGDVFPDGFLFVGSPAFFTGKRLCIDGAALIFHPKTQKEEGKSVVTTVQGDTPKKNDEIPSWFDDPSSN